MVPPSAGKAGGMNKGLGHGRFWDAAGLGMWKGLGCGGVWGAGGFGVSGLPGFAGTCSPSTVSAASLFFFSTLRRSGSLAGLCPEVLPALRMLRVVLPRSRAGSRDGSCSHREQRQS